MSWIGGTLRADCCHWNGMPNAAAPPSSASAATSTRGRWPRAYPMNAGGSARTIAAIPTYAAHRSIVNAFGSESAPTR